MRSRKPTSVRLTPDQKSRLQQLARQRKVSQQTIIRDALQLELFPLKGTRK